ncbi:twin-arginine translocase TatA/TatE family subunit [Candidatus Poriferisodalis sp.]|uniref:twin-arginine translocase TatA/TatE family subunit n=1 Tax=Candidatus Poriferisodalis sp. TaxID=3101277 RepID=UPI003B026657
MSLQPNEVLIIVLVALIVLGPKRLPAAIRSIGQAFRQVREFSTTMRQEIDATLSPPIVDTSSAADAQASATTAENAIASDAPVTDAPVTDAPVTDAPVTDAPAAPTQDAHTPEADSTSGDDTAIDRSTSDGAA